MCVIHMLQILTPTHTCKTLGVDLLWEGQSHKPGCHGNKGRALKGLSDAVALTTARSFTCVIVTSMSINTTSLECGDAVRTSSRMPWIRYIQRSQVLLVIYNASSVNHVLFAEQSHR